MFLKVLGSNSLGNCYLLENEDKCLILEVGINPKEVLKAINFELKKVVGILVTHEHKDHSKYILEWLGRGIKVYMSRGTKEALKLEHRSIVSINPLMQFSIDNFKILSFDVQHDCTEPLGFLINHTDIGNLLFATDTYYLKYKFNNLNHVLLEANYDLEILEESDSFYKKRVLQSHMSIDTTLKTLLANDLSKISNIVLLHLSDSHSDETKFKNFIQSKTGIVTYVANKGLEVQLSQF